MTVNRLLSMTVLAALCAAADGVAAATLDASLIRTSGSPVVADGKFYGYRTAKEGPGDKAFRDALALAKAEHVPLVAIWSNEDCHYCDAFISSLNASKEDAAEWMKDTRAVFAFFKDDTGGNNNPYPGHDPVAGYEAWKFISGTCGSQPYWPLVGFYYEKADGTVVKWKHGMVATKTFSWLKANYADWCEKNHIGEYPSGKFAVTGTTFDRYEAEATTRYVDVELVRTADDGMFVATNVLSAYWPGESGSYWTTNVPWSVGETSRWVRVSLESGLVFPEDGDEITLKLADAYGNLVATTPIVCRADVANSAENPYWKTERTAQTLAFGEWTCDLDVATNRAAAFAAATGKPAWTLVYTHGSLWCPYCYLNGLSFAKTAAFHTWAVSNNVALVSADMPHNSNDNPDVDYGTIWHRKTDYTNLYFDGYGKVARSGNGYLSRKMVSEEEAAAVRAEHRFWSRDFFHLPEDYQDARAIIPGMMLIDASGRLVGRLETFDYDMNMHTNGENAVLYCQRLSEMLRTAETAPERESEILNDCCRTTPLSLSAFPESSAPTCVTGTISHADYRDVRWLKDVSQGLQSVYTLKGTRDAQVRLCLIEDRHGAIPELVTSVTGILSDGLTLDTSSIPGFLFEDGVDYYLRVSCHSFWPNDPYHKSDPNYKTYRLRWGDGDDGFSRDFAADYAGDTVTEYELSATPLFIPQEKYLTLGVPNLAAFHLNVEEGEIYRLTGIGKPSVSDFDAIRDDFYRACVTGAARLEPAGFGAVVGYQLWHPGKVAFGTDGERVIEYAGTGTVSVVRMDGGSNAETVTVRCVAHDVAAEGRYVWHDQTIVWEDGEQGTKEVGFALIGNETFEDDATFTLALEDACGPAELVAPQTNVITICDTDAPCFEKSSYAAKALRSFSSEVSFPVINLREGGRVIVKTLSGTKLPSGLTMKYDAATGSVVLSGIPTKAGTYTFECVVTECRKGGLATGFETTFTVTVEEPGETNPYAVIKRPTQTLALFGEASDGKRRLAGLLDVAVTSKGRISAKYRGTETRTVSFAGTWSALDDSGMVTTVLTSKGSQLALGLDTAGVLTATLVLADGLNYFTAAGGFAAQADWPATGVYEVLKGYYTVNLAQTGVVGRVSVPLGSPYLALTMTASSCIRSGSVRFAGILPDGTSASGTATLRNLFDEGAELPLFVRGSRNVLGAPITLFADGAANWCATNAALREVVVGLGDAAPYVLHRETAASYLTEHEVTGVYYPRGVSPLELHTRFYDEKFGEDTPFALSVDADHVADSERYGAFEDAPVGLVRAQAKRLALDRTQGLAFSFSPSTGVFSGTVRLTFASGKKVTAAYRGAVIPGWINSCDCGFTAPERPFGGGVLYYRDRIDGKACTRSLPVVLDILGR